MPLLEPAEALGAFEGDFTAATDGFFVVGARFKVRPCPSVMSGDEVQGEVAFLGREIGGQFSFGVAERT